MKGIYKITCLLLAVIFMASGMTFAAFAAGENALTITAYDGFAAVTSCRATASGIIDVPSTKDGLPVTRINDGAFENCSSITQVNIPASVTYVGDNAFDSCTSLKSVVFSGGECTIGQKAFISCSALTEITLPSALKEIPNEAFAGCTSLLDITIPSTVEVIGKEAFRICGKLTDIAISSSVKVIKKNAFLGCTSVTSYTVASENSVYSSSNGVIYGPYESQYDSDIESPVTDKALIQYPAGNANTSYTVEEETLIIGDYSFGGNKKLVSVILPDGLEMIDSYAFNECSALSDVVIPSTVTEIGSQAFGKCTSLKSITVPASVEKFDSAFYMAGLEEVTFENGIKTIDSKSFEGCKSLVNVTIPSSVEEIKFGAFYGCTALETVEIPACVTSIGVNAFGNCTDVKLIVVRDSAAYTYAVENDIPYEIKNTAEPTEPETTPTQPTTQTPAESTTEPTTKPTEPESTKKTITSISIESLPIKLDYNYKDAIDTTGLSIKVHYSDGTYDIVDSGLTISPERCTQRGKQTVTVEFESFTAEFNVDVSFTILQWIIWILLLGFLWY